MEWARGSSKQQVNYCKVSTEPFGFFKKGKMFNVKTVKTNSVGAIFNTLYSMCSSFKEKAGVLGGITGTNN